MSGLSIALGGLRLPSPVMPASGTFGLGHARVLALDFDRLGAIVPKTITPQPRAGHPAPRLAEAAGGLVNAIGIPSVGLDAFIEDHVPHYARFAAPLVVSLSADTAEDFACAAARLSRVEGVDGIELNLSCPNLEAGGRLFAADPDAAGAVTAACRAVTGSSLWCKLSPAASMPCEVARACEAAGADALVVANTMPALALDETGGPLLSNRTGGLSGAPLKPVALRLVDAVARSVRLPVIGCGGVATLRDLLDHVAAGASAVAVGTATLVRPGAMGRLVDALEVRLAREGCDAARFIAARHAACGVPPRRAEEARAPSARPAP